MPDLQAGDISQRVAAAQMELLSDRPRTPPWERSIVPSRSLPIQAVMQTLSIVPLELDVQIMDRLLFAMYHQT